MDLSRGASQGAIFTYRSTRGSGEITFRYVWIRSLCFLARRPLAVTLQGMAS
jgi:hypothetical protein